jgi:O-acetyl-ADP-ribose deacetylase (regulator of RNase III)
MGKGVALQFRRAFPANYNAYRAPCAAGEVQLGRMFVFQPGQLAGPRAIINFPTKDHWRSRSLLADIEQGLRDLRRVLLELDVRSVALPPLGCGLGGLRWSDVGPLIEQALSELPLRVLVYEPQPAPAPERMPEARERPPMTPFRATLVGSSAAISHPGRPRRRSRCRSSSTSSQEAGEPLRLRFVKQRYGPYADAARHAVERLEGHHLTGFGDGTGDASVRLLPGAMEEAEAFLADHPETRERYERVAELIDGFETPYGLELLATTHWVAVHEDGGDAQAAARLVREWTERKGRLFTDEHVASAWHRLEQGGWFAGSRVAAGV